MASIGIPHSKHCRNPDNKRPLSKNLGWWRLYIAHMTQQKVADTIGVSAKVITAWECDRATPSPEQLLALLETLKVPCKYWAEFIGQDICKCIKFVPC